MNYATRNTDKIYNKTDSLRRITIDLITVTLTLTIVYRDQNNF